MNVKEAMELAQKAVQKQYSGLKITGCVDIGESFVFSIDDEMDDIQPGLPMICVNKKSSDITEMTIPPLENLDVLENGTEINFSAEAAGNFLKMEVI